MLEVMNMKSIGPFTDKCIIPETVSRLFSVSVIYFNTLIYLYSRVFRANYNYVIDINKSYVI